jgi:hypothetical protein
VCAGIGAQRVLDRISTIRAVPWRWALGAALAGALLTSAVNLARYYPQTLSHYSLIAGGVRGAADRGMEPAYWWDALDNDVLKWINDSTGPDEALAFSPVFDLGQLRDSGKLRAPTVDAETGPFKFYVLQNRPGMFTPTDRVLMGSETPAYAKYAGRRPGGTAVPRDLDVPLISVFSFDQYQRARAAAR